MWTKLLPEAGGCNLMFLPEAAGGGQNLCRRLGSSMVPLNEECVLALGKAKQSQHPSTPLHAGSSPGENASASLHPAGAPSPASAPKCLQRAATPLGMSEQLLMHFVLQRKSSDQQGDAWQQGNIG